MSQLPAEAAHSAGLSSRREIGISTGFVLAIAAVIVATALVAEGGLTLADTTWMEVGLTLAGGATVAVAILKAAGSHRMWGGLTLLSFALLTALIGASIAWSVAPSESWNEFGRTVSYLFVLAGAIALVRLAPGRWRELVGGLLLGAVIVSVGALMTKIAPGIFASDEVFARLREPFGYWNGVAGMAAFGVPLTLWLGARESGHPALRVLAYPALALLLLTMTLAYSRGGLLAAAVGVALWFAIAPRRLRSLAVLTISFSAAAIVTAWATNTDSLSLDRIPLDARIEGGIQLAVAVILMVGVTAAFATTLEVLLGRRPLSDQERAFAGGVAGAIAIVLPIVAVVALAITPGGLTGRITNAWNSFTNTEAAVPDNGPGRLTAAGSVRAKYWDQALDVWAESRWTGVGADGYTVARARFSNDFLEVRHAHGYIVQTLADLGIIGLVLSLLVLLAWVWAAVRTVRRRGPPDSQAQISERVALIALICAVLVFGVHSLLDWTWFIPAAVVFALLAAGWVAGRGPIFPRKQETEALPLQPPPAQPPGKFVTFLTDPRTERWTRYVTGTAVILVSIFAAYVIWQPLRAQEHVDSAYQALASGNTAQATRLANSAEEEDPLSLEPLTLRAAAFDREGKLEQAELELQQAVVLQPANPKTWLQLGIFQLRRLEQPRRALSTLKAAVYLDPQSTTVLTTYLEAQRAYAFQKAERALKREQR